ncbi:helix-turn-helix transcriptional regulator [Candidatus Binatus sp.]|uniref:helix-turn-helix transcriptional regulator n=1 Tax=Candidatus Binatus sp. TaxID=2811406 RepID=UPI003C6F17E1
MPEIQSSESEESDRLSSILAGYLTQKDLAQALGVSERTIARWHHFREGPPRVEFGRKVFYRLESVSAWIASCERPEPRAGRTRRARLRAVDPSRVPVSTQRNNVGPLAGSGGSHN